MGHSALRKQRLGLARGQPKTTPVPMQAPYSGLNTRDALDAMQLTDALVMDNFFPSEGEVEVRGGSVEIYDSGEALPIESLHEYDSGAIDQLIAGVNGKLYDMTAGPPATIGTGFSDDDWDAINFDDELILVNGDSSDRAKRWDGTTLSNSAWTGPSPDDGIFSGVHVHKERLFYWTGVDADFWYANAVYIKTGTVVKFPLSRIGSFGGVLIDMETWTLDGGDGPDDYAVFLMSSGTVIVYEGTDPGIVALWALVGIYKTAEPMGGHKAMTKVGADVMIQTRDDIIPLTQILKQGYIGTKSKISGGIRKAFSSSGDAFGWQMTLAPEGRMFIVNYPLVTTNNYNQYVMNTITGAWCRFTALPASCWGQYNGATVFGGTDGKVYDLSGATDDGTAIDAIATQAWSDMGMPYEKNTTLCRPVISAEGDINYEFGVGFDFVEALPSAASAAAAGGSPWDTSPWDTSDWSDEDIVYTSWRPCSGKGQMISSTLRVSAEQKIAWLRTDFRLKQGSRL